MSPSAAKRPSPRGFNYSISHFPAEEQMTLVISCKRKTGEWGHGLSRNPDNDFLAFAIDMRVSKLFFACGKFHKFAFRFKRAAGSLLHSLGCTIKMDNGKTPEPPSVDSDIKGK